MLRILIVDDEPLARAELKLLLAERSDTIVAGEADSLESALAQLEQCDPDVMFLDIRLRGASGFDVFDRTVVRCHVVFLTAYEDQALRAFEVNALDYLVKPIDAEDLERALSRVLWRPPPVPIRKSAPRMPSEERVFFKEPKKLRACPVSEIVFLRAARADTEVHLTSGEVVLVREGLQSWEERLPTSFVRVHRSSLVNLSFIETLAFTQGRWEVQLRGVSETLPVSRRLVQSVKAQLQTRESSSPRPTTDSKSRG